MKIMYNEEAQKKSSGGILERIFHRRKKRLFSNIELEFQKYLDAFTIFTVLFIFLGVVLAIWSGISSIVLRIFIAFSFFLYAGIAFYFFFRRRELSFYNFCILYGIISFLLGTFVFFQENIQGVLNLLGVFYLTISFGHYLESFYFFRMHDNDALVLLVSNVLIDFIAILLFINPFAQLLGGEVIGVFLILFGILQISILSFLNKKSSSFLSFFES